MSGADSISTHHIGLATFPSSTTESSASMDRKPSTVVSSPFLARNLSMSSSSIIPARKGRIDIWSPEMERDVRLLFEELYGIQSSGTVLGSNDRSVRLMRSGSGGESGASFRSSLLGHDASRLVFGSPNKVDSSTSLFMSPTINQCSSMNGSLDLMGDASVAMSPYLAHNSTASYSRILRMDAVDSEEENALIMSLWRRFGHDTTRPGVTAAELKKKYASLCRIDDMLRDVRLEEATRRTKDQQAMCADASMSFASTTSFVLEEVELYEEVVNAMNELKHSQGAMLPLPASGIAPRLRTVANVCDIITKDAARYTRLRDGAHRTLLHRACALGLLPIVQTLALCGADLKEKDIDGNTPLMYALRGAHRSCVNYVLDRDVNSEKSFLTYANGRGVTPLHVACHANDALIIRRILVQLQHKGPTDATSTSRDRADSDPPVASSPLSAETLPASTVVNSTSNTHASNCRTAPLSILPDEVINAADSHGRTPLHVASHRCTREICEWLLQCGADSERKDRAGNPPVALAQKMNKSGNVSYLSHRGRVAIHAVRAALRMNRILASTTVTTAEAEKNG